MARDQRKNKIRTALEMATAIAGYCRKTEPKEEMPEEQPEIRKPQLPPA